MEHVALRWDVEFGNALIGAQVALHNFKFPYSGKSWDSFSVGTTGSISFDAADGRSGSGGVPIGRFDQLSQAARTLVNTVPAICVFLKPRMSGPRYVKESADRVTITWDLTEPAGGIQDFTWVKTTNRFQAVLQRDGVIEMSYEQVAAKDAIVGLYPLIASGAERVLATISGEKNPAVAPHLNIQSIKVAVVNNLFLKVTLETRGPILTPGDPALAGIVYRVFFDTRKLDTHKPTAARQPGTDGNSQVDAVWTVRGVGAQGRGGRRGGSSRYFAGGPGVSPDCLRVVSLRCFAQPQRLHLHGDQIVG